LFGADTYGLFFLFKQAIEKAGSTDPDKLRNAMEDASWETPQGTKTIRKGDHQAVVDMVVVKVKGNDFHTVGKVPGAEAVGPDKCDKF
jgi:branched-chain amino acid transport system substrate-binding protein